MKTQHIPALALWPNCSKEAAEKKKGQKPLTFVFLLQEGSRESVSLPYLSLEAVQVHNYVLRQNRDVPEARKSLIMGCFKQSRAVGQQ